jgi:hypothetical protein
MSERTDFPRTIVAGMNARGGVRFDRRADGAVVVWREAEQHERLETYEGPQYRRLAIIPANEWASIVATLGVAGENGTTHTMALALHQGATAYDVDAHEHETELDPPAEARDPWAGAPWARPMPHPGAPR